MFSKINEEMPCQINRIYATLRRSVGSGVVFMSYLEILLHSLLMMIAYAQIYLFMYIFTWNKNPGGGMEFMYLQKRKIIILFATQKVFFYSFFVLPIVHTSCARVVAIVSDSDSDTNPKWYELSLLFCASICHGKYESIKQNNCVHLFDFCWKIDIQIRQITKGHHQYSRGFWRNCSLKKIHTGSQ